MTFHVSPFRTPAWKPLALVSALSAIFIFPSAHAETETVQSLPPVVVTASRVVQLQSEALPDTTVITAEDIRNSRASDVISLLQRQAGIEFAQNGGPGSAASLFMRGANSNQNLVLIDGVPVSDPTATGTAAALQHILPDQIERIEIVRGNVSAIYGSGAIGGVIQIFTKRGSGEPKVNVSAEVGSHGATKVSGGVSGQSGGTRYSVSATRFETDGESAINTNQYPNANPDKDAARNMGVAATLSHEWNPGQEFGARVYANDAEFKYDNTNEYSGSATDIHEGTSKHHTLAAFSKNRFTSNWSSTVTVSTSETDRKDITIGSSVSRTEYKGTTNMFQWNNEVVVLPDWVVTMGTSRSEEKALIDASSDLNRSRNNSSVYGGINGKIQAHSLQANVRYDDVGSSGSDTTAYLGYGYDLTSSWKMIASTSTAFLAPTLYQLYDGTYGNTNLKAEHSRSKEVGVQYASGPTLIRTVFFETHTRDMLDTIDTGGFVYKYVNVNKARSHGMEVTASTRFAETDIRASLTLQSAKNEETGEALSRRAKTLGSLAASRSFGVWRAGGDIQYVGHRDNSGYDTYELPSYVLANLNARYQFNKALSVYARIENLFDRDYQTVYGYNQAGRGYFAGIEWRQ